MGAFIRCANYYQPTVRNITLDKLFDILFLFDIGAIFLCRFRLYKLSFMFRFMFANICFEKNQNSKIHVMFIINIT